MLTGIRLENFKCFKALSLPLSPLTLLTGFNAGGKSTSLQTLLLLAQTLRSQQRGPELRLNGQLVHLGSPGDVINQQSGGTEIELGIETETVAIRWLLRADDSDDRRTLSVAQIEIKSEQGNHHIGNPVDLDHLIPGGIDAQPARNALLTVSEIIYVSALRQVDTDVFPVPEEPKPIHGDVGTLGEHAAWWFHNYDDLEVDSLRCVSEKEFPKTLRGQVNAWAGELFGGAEANAQPITKTNLVRLELRTGRTEDWRRPSNIGYGLSYAFPILVAGLCAKRGQILVVDSPEAHLHPRGQSRMGKFLAQVAVSGPQLIVETHSDHILNGVRLAVRDAAIAPGQVTVHFFNPSPAEGFPQVTTVSADRNGNLSQWPEGFFDQSEKDLATLAGWN